ncbi:MAG TPA: hypothetical protein VNA04_04010 [Thermoanaerobaculia bacterium]|nr:hypothetical protein [Thermoanaerobaculia bacterium]
MLQKVILAVALLVAPNIAHAQGIERFLVPVYLSGPTPGAFGSVWTSELRILNTGTTDAVIENFGLMNQTGLFTPETLPSGVEIAGRRLNNAVSVANPGALLLVRSEFAEQLRFQSRVRDTSREGQGWGTWIPVVHESAARGVLHLLDVPVDPRYRQMLRVYSFDRVAGRSVRIRLYATRENAQFPSTADPIVSELVLPLQVIGGDAQPAYAQISDVSTLPGVAGQNRVRITIQTEGSFGVWSMASITNNVTQEVTMIVPDARQQ